MPAVASCEGSRSFSLHNVDSPDRRPDEIGTEGLIAMLNVEAIKYLHEEAKAV
jgi:hypothetical protein